MLLVVNLSTDNNKVNVAAYIALQGLIKMRSRFIVIAIHVGL